MTGARRRWLGFLWLAGLAVSVAACKGDDGSSEGETGETGDTGSAGAYVFAEDEPSAYARVDRIGMPAIGTAVIVSKQAYNEADPTDDVAGDFVAEITASVEGLHAALDDDLANAGLTPCAPDACVTQAAPLVVPDTLKIDLSQPAGFPNGRQLSDPVIDVTLAVVLLDLSVDGQDPTSLVGALNPTANDLAFEVAFPYLALPHQL